MLKAQDISLDTKLMLLNAVYFKGTWSEKFNSKYTKEKPFHIAAGQEIMVMV